MRPTRNIHRALSTALALAVVACAWFFFAPSALGGSTSYVVTDGISMQPRFHSGDLVLVRPEGDYRVGQIVAYHNRQLGTIVLHRIVGRVGSRYVFKGDNNNFMDFEHPARSQLIGALWMHVPGMGADLASVRSPALIGGLFAIGTLLLGGAAFVRRRRRRGRDRRAAEPGLGLAAPAPLSAAVSRGAVPVMLSVGLAAISPFVVLALIAFTRPSSAAISANVPYAQHGRLAYEAAPSPGPAYPAGRVRTGDPVFTRVVGSLGFRYTYRFSSPEAHHVAGNAQLTATLTSTSGWRTTIPLGRPAPFHGDVASVSAPLDVTSLLGLTSRVEAVTAVHGTYTLTIAPRVTVDGRVGGAPLHATFSAPSRFSLNKLEIRPVTSNGSASGETADPSALFATAAQGTATARQSRPADLSLGAIGISVEAARAIALGGIALIAFALAGAMSLLRPSRRDETSSILSRYGSLIVPVECVWQLPGVSVIDVADMDALARIAAHYERSILHERTDYGDAFWVSDESGQFRYAVWAEEDEDVWTVEDMRDEEASRREPADWEPADLRGSLSNDTLQYGAVSPRLLPQG